MADTPDEPRGPHHPDITAAPYARDLPRQSAPGTHRTPPDAEGKYVEVFVDEDGLNVGVWDPIDHYGPASIIAPDALPDLVAALAAHLTVDARRALTRDLAAQDGDAVVAADDALIASAAVGFPGLSDRLEVAARAAVEAARPTPTPEETHRG